MKKNWNQIEVIFSDVDGTLTDGRLYYNLTGEALKVFHSHDGHGIKLWQMSGKTFGVLTSRRSKYVQVRFRELGVKDLAIGIYDKLSWMQKWLKKNNLDFSNLAYIGDDLNDLELIQQAYFSAAPSNAVGDVKKASDYICKLKGGEGAVREFIDFLLLKLKK